MAAVAPLQGAQVLQQLPPAGPAVPQRITLGQPWPHDKYTKISRLGRGAFGEAWLARSRLHNNKLVVCKEVNVSQMSERERQDALNEVRIIRALSHPNVVRLYDWFSYSKYLVMVMEYADGGDLLRRVKQNRDRGQPIKEETILNWGVQILLAIAYLHSKRILHRDIKAENIFLTSGNIVKVGDFGISTVLRHTMAQAQTVCGTPYYFSPELCERRPYNNKSDVWAIGVVLYECIALRKPFEARNLVELTRYITRQQYPPMPPGYSAGVYDVVARMLHKEPSARLSIPQILRLSIIKQALERWETSQDAVLKENQPGLPPGFGVLARRAAAEKESLASGGGVAGMPVLPPGKGAALPAMGSAEAAGPYDRDVREREPLRDVNELRRAPSGVNAGNALPGLPQAMGYPRGGALGVPPVAPPAVAGPPPLPQPRGRSPVGGAGVGALAAGGLLGGHGYGGPLGGVGGVLGGGVGARPRRGSEALDHLAALAQRRRVEAQSEHAGGHVHVDQRAAAADQAFLAAAKDYSDAELRAQQEAHVRDNRRARENIHHLIKQILDNNGADGADEDFADADGIPVDIK